MASAPLPREIIKWLQSLDLSFSVKNPKRDLCNGFLVAEIMNRYYPKDVDILTYENGARLECKVDNWEQLYKCFQKQNFGMTKPDFDPVIHCAPHAAEGFLFKLYNCLTKRTVKLMQPATSGEPLPAFMRDTASKRMKDPEVDRITDNVERTIAAIDVLGYYHQERRQLKDTEAPLLISKERRERMGLAKDLAEHSKEEQVESTHIDEVKVKALQGGKQSNRATTEIVEGGTQGPKTMSSRTQLLKAVAAPKTCVGALVTLQQPALFVKPAAEIMRPLVFSIVQESKELSKMIDTGKDIVVSFMEQCREGIPDASKDRDWGNRTSPPIEQRMREVEETSVRVFETLATRAQLLVDTLTKSPPEFWKVWSIFYPALTDFSESSPIFESAVFFFKRLGDLMREADPQLTQQLITEVGLPLLVKELSKAPEKREALCEIIYSFTQEDTLNHLLALRALKDKLADNLPVYVSCLACLIAIDAQLGLLDEHLLDLYIYYALVAMQNPQPRIRVAGIAILTTITTNSNQYQSIVPLIPSFAALAGDEWWEVQAQLLRLAAHLLSKLSATERQDANTYGDDDEGSASASSKAGDFAPAEAEVAVDGLLSIISRLFVVSNSKNVLQVGLSSLVHLLPEYPTLLPMFVTVLLEQRPALRQRLLRPQEEGEAAERIGRLTYVMGNSSRMYEEKCISSSWPHLDIAKTLVMQLEVSPLDHFELEHMEVLLASLPRTFEELEADEWLQIFEKVKQYIFVALVDPDLHLLSTQIIRRFWVCPLERIAARSIEASKKTLLQALQLLYSGKEPLVDEAAVLVFLRDLRSKGGELQIEIDSVVELFKETHPKEYKASQLETIFG
eukprot:TRINITY_DN14331_c0_g5_i1.p1 TRINITY_DN14331_c0_g5~~TRINITY_DN14331_c0_g5_i1.p1  ORF type:complete len:848 (+),score=176.39 TRINITY_DN14331_c0_g5_i1:57-2600(+)